MLYHQKIPLDTRKWKQSENKGKRPGREKTGLRHPSEADVSDYVFNVASPLQVTTFLIENAESKQNLDRRVGTLHTRFGRTHSCHTKQHISWRETHNIIITSNYFQSEIRYTLINNSQLNEIFTWSLYNKKKHKKPQKKINIFICIKNYLETYSRKWPLPYRTHSI